jgi:7-cyano-7-deazaguanine synthase
VRSALLLSGGMDSLCVAWWKRPEVAICIDYGQLPAKAETLAARAICEALQIELHLVNVDCRKLGSGDMAGTGAHPNAPAEDWWPYRNQLLATLGAMKAISLRVNRLMFGTVRSDHTHQDGTPAFLSALNALLSLQEGAMTAEAPAIDLSTLELIRHSGVPASLLAWAHSCHKADVPCADCRGCNKYFATLGELERDLEESGQSLSAPGT